MGAFMSRVDKSARPAISNGPPRDDGKIVNGRSRPNSA
jgi:hypothetical protein